MYLYGGSSVEQAERGVPIDLAHRIALEPRCHHDHRRHLVAGQPAAAVGEEIVFRRCVPAARLDRCGHHGVWLDKKELKKVIRSVRAHCAVIGLIAKFDDTGDYDDDDD